MPQAVLDKSLTSEQSQSQSIKVKSNLTDDLTFGPEWPALKSSSNFDTQVVIVETSLRDCAGEKDKNLKKQTAKRHSINDVKNFGYERRSMVGYKSIGKKVKNILVRTISIEGRCFTTYPLPF